MDVGDAGAQVGEHLQHAGDLIVDRAPFDGERVLVGELVRIDVAELANENSTVI